MKKYDHDGRAPGQCECLDFVTEALLTYGIPCAHRRVVTPRVAHSYGGAGQLGAAAMDSTMRPKASFKLCSSGPPGCCIKKGPRRRPRRFLYSRYDSRRCAARADPRTTAPAYGGAPRPAPIIIPPTSMPYLTVDSDSVLGVMPLWSTRHGGGAVRSKCTAGVSGARRIRPTVAQYGDNGKGSPPCARRSLAGRISHGHVTTE